MHQLNSLSPYLYSKINSAEIGMQRKSAIAACEAAMLLNSQRKTLKPLLLEILNELNNNLELSAKIRIIEEQFERTYEKVIAKNDDASSPEALANFYGARLANSLGILSQAKSTNDFINAIYESIYSCSDHNAIISAALSVWD